MEERDIHRARHVSAMKRGHVYSPKGGIERDANSQPKPVDSNQLNFAPHGKLKACIVPSLDTWLHVRGHAGGSPSNAHVGV